MDIIDTHQHLLYPDRFRYSWCKGIPALEGKSFGLDEYRAAAEGTGITSTVFMEVDVDESQIPAETDFFLNLASEPASRIAGVIAACRPERQEFSAQVDRSLHPKLRGFRRILHTQPDELSQTPLFAKNLSQLAQRNLSFDLCLLARQLPIAARLASRVSEVQLVLDHCGVPNVKDREMSPWRRDIRELAHIPNLACKISGVVAYCDPANVTTDAVRPFIEHCIECFGWDRVVFGGDWPVCNITSSLPRWVEIAKEIVGEESAERQEKFFFRNANRIYRLETEA
jgi:predicted TIM-barrel fold metal-dependent hydrolase